MCGDGRCAQYAMKSHTNAFLQMFILFTDGKFGADNHTKSVNCVRWSPNGVFLASGSDDRCVFVWQQVGGSSGARKVFGSDDVVHESWKPFKVLSAHVGGIQMHRDDVRLLTAVAA